MTAPSQVDIKITLNGVDVTAYCDLSQAQPEIVSALNEELDTLTLTLQDASTVNPLEWQEIVVKDGAAKIFGGYVIDVTKKKGRNAADNDYDLGCSDYAILLDKVIIRAKYENKADKEIIADIFTNAAELSTFDGTTYVETILTLPRARFNRKSAREALDWICEQSGGHWYMDYDKKLHYFKSEEFGAPFDVCDTPNDASRMTVQNPSVIKDGAGVVNLVEIVGGNFLSEDRTDVLSASGVSNTIRLLNRMQPPSTATSIVVKRNDGGPTTNLVVNPSFEINITDGWTQFQIGSGGTWTQDASKHAVGINSLQIKAGTAVTLMQGQTIALAAGETLTVQAKVWCASAYKAAVVIWDIDNSLNRGECYNSKTSTWETVTAGYYNDTGVTLNVRVELYNNANDGITLAYYDAVQAEKKTWPTSYCDGSLGTGYAWTGTAHNSTSTRVDIPIWTTLTVKVGNIDELSGIDEILYYFNDALLTQIPFFPGLVNAIEVTGRYEIPIRTRVRNQASHDYYGKWMEGVVSAPDILDKAVGILRGKTELLKNSFANPAIRYTVEKPGLRAGQNQKVTFTSMGVDDNYLIQRVTTRIWVGGLVSSEVELGVVDKSLVGLLLQLKRASLPVIEWKEDEVLDEILDTAESVAMTEATPIVSGHSGIYKWDDGTKWGFGKWA